ncbi:hypothetical protein O6H91_01G034300 [Diphasiastrum complanatum]|uniref:Uncharacterized protein n=1 Tax=Diphasiastrum complanatum TaxID=34168 RepID=A0ACC2EPX8_DIPCM|nr:hypothetical protein O6H91_01G034300 [Diphasiastrum complanatum]
MMFLQEKGRAEMLKHQLCVLKINGFMDSETDSELCRVQVVYYLNRRGRTQSPHMIEVLHSARHGLRLRDVKKRLQFLRGNGMPNRFSWSYKRNYRSKYIWQDLCDDDVMDPGNGREYILKGSEILDGNQDKHVKQDLSHQLAESWKLHPEALKNKYRGAEFWLRSPVVVDKSVIPASKYITQGQHMSSYPQVGKHFPIGWHNPFYQQGYNFQDESLSEQKQVMDASTGEDQESRGESKLLNSRKDSYPSEFQDIEPVMRTIDYGCDAATQTEENGQPIRGDSSQVAQGIQQAEVTVPHQPLKQTNNSKRENLLDDATICESPAAIVASNRSSFHPSKAQTKAATFIRQLKSNLKFKHAATPWTPLHILSCTTVDTKLQNCTMLNLEAKTGKSFNESLVSSSDSDIQQLSGEDYIPAFPSQEADKITVISTDTSKPIRRTPRGSLNLKKTSESKSGKSSTRVSSFQLPSIRDTNTPSPHPTKDVSCSEEDFISTMEEDHGNRNPATKIISVGLPLLECRMKMEKKFWASHSGHWAHLS